MYLLDTNVISAVRRPDRAPKVTVVAARQARAGPVPQRHHHRRDRASGVQQQRARDPAFAADLRAWLDRTILLFSDRLLPFEAEDARIWGALSARIGHTGADLMIAATALRHSATVVTGNVSDFAPTGVQVENPF